MGCGLADLLFPDECRLCDRRLRKVSRIPVCRARPKQPQPLAADFYCRTCRTRFPNRHPLDETGQCTACRLGGNGFDEVFSAGAYEGALRKLIHLFEFEGVRPLARPLSGLLVQAPPGERPFDVIAPMPLDWRRRGRRGFHQSELLAGDRLAGVERGLVLAAASGSGRP